MSLLVDHRDEPTYAYRWAQRLGQRLGLPRSRSIAATTKKVLERLKEEEVVRAFRPDCPPKGVSEFYEPTARAPAARDRWFRQPVPWDPDPPLDELLLRILSSRPQHARPVLGTLKDHLRKCYKHLKEIEHAPVEGDDWQNLMLDLKREDAIQALEGRVRWLQNAIRRVEEYIVAHNAARGR